MLAALALLLLAAQPAPAPGSAAFNRCIRGAAGVTVDVAACQTRELARRDATLNVAYRSALGRLPTDRRAALREDERRWLRERDRACRAAASEDGQGTAAPLDAQNCLIDKTRTRTAFLQSSR